LNNYITNILKT